MTPPDQTEGPASSVIVWDSISSAFPVMDEVAIRALHALNDDWDGKTKAAWDKAAEWDLWRDEEPLIPYAPPEPLYVALRRDLGRSHAFRGVRVSRSILAARTRSLTARRHWEGATGCQGDRRVPWQEHEPRHEPPFKQDRLG